RAPAPRGVQVPPTARARLPRAGERCRAQRRPRAAAGTGRRPPPAGPGVPAMPRPPAETSPAATRRTARRRGSCAVEGCVLAGAAGIAVHRRAFLVEEAGDRRAEARIGDVMRGMRGCRFEAAHQLVLALRARFETCQAPFDAVVDALVVAGLEMQAVQFARRAPVAPEQRVAA